MIAIRELLDNIPYVVAMILSLTGAGLLFFVPALFACGPVWLGIIFVIVGLPLQIPMVWQFR